MILGVDGSNLRQGGSFTHLANLLEAARPHEHGIERVVVWGARSLIELLPSRVWLDFRHEPLLEKGLPARLFWQAYRLPKCAEESCDLLFAPGGNAPHRFTPLVTMSRNMLPFELSELARYGARPTTLRLLLLRYGQTRSFRRADGVVFLTQYARRVVKRATSLECDTCVIPHGIADCFRSAPREQRSLDQHTIEDPLKILYVSIVDAYKHQVPVAKAVAALRSSGLPIMIDFIGPGYGPAMREFRATISELDPAGEFLCYRGAVHHNELAARYHTADMFVFASSCENMPNILVEAMAAGLPIACSDRGPMPELLGEGGEFFNPEKAESIASAVRRLATDQQLRMRCARTAYRRAQDFTWERCARETLEFIASTYRKSARDRALSSPQGQWRR